MNNLSYDDINITFGNWSGERSNYYLSSVIDTNFTDFRSYVDTQRNLVNSSVTSIGNWTADKVSYWNTSLNVTTQGFTNYSITDGYVTWVNGSIWDKINETGYYQQRFNTLIIANDTGYFITG